MWVSNFSTTKSSFSLNNPLLLLSLCELPFFEPQVFWLPFPQLPLNSWIESGRKPPKQSRPCLFERQGNFYSNSSNKLTPKPLCPILLPGEHIAHFTCKSLLSLRICPCKNKICVFTLSQGNHFSEIKLSNMKDLLILWLYHNHFFSFTLWPLRLLLWLLTLPSSFLNVSPRYWAQPFLQHILPRNLFLSRVYFHMPNPLLKICSRLSSNCV